MEILNLTGKRLPTELEGQGIVDPPKEYRKAIRELNTFGRLPTEKEIKDVARQLSDIAAQLNYGKVLISRAPFLIPFLVEELKRKGITPVFAFTTEQTVEYVTEHGNKKRKRRKILHGFVELRPARTARAYSMLQRLFKSIGVMLILTSVVAGTYAAFNGIMHGLIMPILTALIGVLLQFNDL